MIDVSDKKRYVISADGKYIRANHGHSINIDLELTETKPPDILYHGTALKSIESIKNEGLIKGKRLYVHLSSDIDSAIYRKKAWRTYCT